MAPGPNLEARARAARYGALPAGVATGHTMDDQAETILVNLLRGAGADGLAGMEPGHRHPLLDLRRAETHALCGALGWEPVRDATNLTTPPSCATGCATSCSRSARRWPDATPSRSWPARRRCCATRWRCWTRWPRRRCPTRPTRAPWRGTERPLARRALRQWLRAVAPVEGGHPPSLAEVDRVLAVAQGAAVGTELSGGRRVRRSHGRLGVGPDGSGIVTPVTREEAGTGVPSWAEPDVGPVLVGADELAARVAELGAQITADYADEPPLLVAVLKGAMLFMSDLCRAIALPVDVDFMAVSSYGSATKTSGVVRIVKDLDSELDGRHVLVVEDIIDSGLTLNYLRRYLNARQPKSVEVCALLVKEGEQRVELDLKYTGFVIPPEFVVGYGLDVAERYRNLHSVHRYKGTEQ